MTGDADLVGRISACADREWIDRHVIEESEAAAFAELHGYEATTLSDGIVPPGFAAVVVQRAVLAVLHDSELALPFDRNLHAAQSLEWHAPLRVGAQLTTSARVENLRPRERAVFFDVRTVTTDERGAVLLGVGTQAVRHA